MVDEAKWNAAYPWAEVGSENYEEYMEVQATEPGRSRRGRVAAGIALWRDRVRDDIRSSLYDGEGLPRPSHPAELDAANASFRAYLAEMGPGPYEPEDTYAAWLLSHAEE